MRELRLRGTPVLGVEPEQATTALRDDDDWRARVVARFERVTGKPLLALAVLAVPLGAFELRSGAMSDADSRVVAAISVVVWALFAFDFVFRLSFVRARGDFVRREWPNLLLALAVPTFLPVLGPLRLVRPLLRIGASAKEISHEAKRHLSDHPVNFVAGFAFCTWAISSGAIFLVEGDATGAFPSPADAFWWSAVTMATVGYGDLSPVTSAGRLVALFTMLGGIGSFSLLTGAFSSFLVERHAAGADSRATDE